MSQTKRDPVRVTINSLVVSKDITKQSENGRDYYVVPSYTLPSNVIMNGLLYPASEIDAHYPKLENTLAPLGHPFLNGEPISASSPHGINMCHIGAFNRNVKKDGNRVFVEKWIDLEVAQSTEKGRELLDRLDKLMTGEEADPIHTSVAVIANVNAPPAGAKYKGIVELIDIDHDAILLNEKGAATPDQGVGMMVNAEDAVPAGKDVLDGVSYEAKRQALHDAIVAKLGQAGKDDYFWIEDFTDDKVIVSSNTFEGSRMYPYTMVEGRPQLGDEFTEVKPKRSWIANLMAFVGNWSPSKEKEETKMDEKTIANALAAAMAAALEPVTQKLDQINNQQAEMMRKAEEAAAKAAEEKLANEEKPMREAVAAVHGEVVANSLSGEPLKALFEKLPKPSEAPAATVPGNLVNQQTGLTAPAPESYYAN